jgi:hypothetical protein
MIELAEGVELPKNTVVFVVIPDQSDEIHMRQHLVGVVQTTFTRLWDNEEDEVWNGYL